MPSITTFPVRRTSTHNISVGIPRGGTSHRTTESASQLSLTDNNPPQSSAHSLQQQQPGHTFVPPGMANANNWEDKLMNSFFKSIKDKLPCYSGTHLLELEADESVMRTVDALVHMTHSRMGQIVWLLLELLEKLYKQTTDSQDKWRQDVLQSQLFLLKILSACLTFQWDHAHTQRRGPGSTDFRDGRHPMDTPHHNPADWVEPPPLKDDNAAYIISVMGLYVRQTRHAIDRPADFLHMTNDTSFHSLEVLEIINPDTRRIMTQNELLFGTSELVIEPTVATIIPYDNSLNRLILKYASRVIFHVSASNWSTVYHRVRKGIHQHANSSNSGGDDLHEYSDLWLIAFCAFDRVRLVQVLQELASLLVNMRIKAQIEIAQALRRAMWNWINVFPSEFADASVNPRKLDGAAERLYDVMQQLADADRRLAFWPCLTLLMCTSPERLKQAEEALTLGPADTTIKAKAGAKAKQRLAAWAEIAKTLGSASRLAELAMACFVKICKCAMVVSPEVDAPIRSIAQDLAQELMTRLIHPPQPLRPFWDDLDHTLDVGLYSDCLVTMYRYDPVNAIQHAFIPALHATRSETVKAIAVKACLTLALEKRAFPHQPSMEPLYDLAERLRAIFTFAVHRQNEVSETGQTLRASNRPLMKRYYLDDSTSERDLLFLVTHALWRVDPRFWFEKIDEKGIESMGHHIAELQRSNAPEEVQTSIVRTFGVLWLVAGVLQPENPVYLEARKLFRINSLTTLIAAITMFLLRGNDVNQQRIYAPYLSFVFGRYAEVGPDDPIRAWKFKPERIMAFSAGEIACLHGLISPATDVSVQCAKVLQLIARAEQQEGAPLPPFLSRELIKTRWRLYEQIGNERHQLVGRAAHQRRLRHLLSVLAVPNSISLVFFNLASTRWTELTQQLDRAPDSGSDPALRYAWQNYTQLLAVFVGSCVPVPGEQTEIMHLGRHFPQHIEHLASFPQQPLNLAKSFVQELVGLLDHESVIMRETVREALGLELNPRLFLTLMSLMDAKIHRLHDQERPDEGVPLLVEQLIPVLHNVLTRLDSTLETAKNNVDISRTVMAISRMFRRGDVSKAAYRVKLKFCQLCDTLIKKKDLVSVRKENSLRNALVEKCFEWIKDSQNHLKTIDPMHLRIQAESDTACLSTAVTLLQDLRLEPPDQATSSDKANLLSRLFNRYFMDMQRMAGIRNMGAMQSEEDLAESFTSASRQGRDEPAIRELVVTGIVNMFQANVDAGAKHCLALGIEADTRQRVMFCQIFSRILQSENRLKLEGIGDPSPPPQRNQLCDMLRQSDLLALAVCEICPANEVEILIPILLNVFDTRESLVRLMKTAIDKEISRTDSDRELFRSNTVCTRLLGAFAKMQGYNYLRGIIEPSIMMLINVAAQDEQSVEIDPAKAPLDADLAANAETLKSIAQTLIDTICNSVDQLPAVIMDVCRYIATAVRKQWPNNWQTAVGAFLFLRFTCPAIVSPGSIDIECPTNRMDFQRTLILLTKIIQALANNILFGKEAYTVVLNPLLEANGRKFRGFIEHVALGDSNGEMTIGDHHINSQFDETDAIVLQRYLSLHADKVGKALLSSTSSEAANINGKRTWDRLCAALVELGTPIDGVQFSSLDSIRHPKFLEFMNRNQQRVIDPAKADLFVEAGVRDDTLVFVLALSKINVETDDLEMILSHIYKTLLSSEVRTRKFEIVVDCTAFWPSSQIPLAWIKYLLELTTSDVRTNFQKAYLVNANSTAQVYFRKILHGVAKSEFSKYFTALSKVQDLVDILPSGSLAAMPGLAALEREPRDTFPNVVQVLRGTARLSVSFELGQTHIKITSTRSQPIFPQVQCKATEILYLSEIGDVTPYASDKSPEFTIRRQRQGGTLIFASPYRDLIIQAIRSAKSRLKGNDISLSIERGSRNVGLPATVMNVGLMHLCHEDEVLRSAAHDLLCALTTYLEYDGPPFLQAKGSFIPSNTAASAIPFCEALAKFSPNLTLDYIYEFCANFDKLSAGQKAISLQFVTPWIKNLNIFLNPSSTLFDAGKGKLRECLRNLIDITIKDPETYPLAQRHVWVEIGKLDSQIIDLAIDELVRVAVDTGISSLRCELVADTLVSLSSVSVRGKVIHRLRKAFSKTSHTQTRDLVENPAWPEIAALTRLALVVSYTTRQPIQTQLYAPETAHLIVILAGVGPINMRVMVHGLLVNLVQSLHSSRIDSPEIADQLRVLLEESAHAETLRWFGLSRIEDGGEPNMPLTFSDVEAVDALENITRYLKRVLTIASCNQTMYNTWAARWMSLVASTAFQISPYIQGRAFASLGVLATDHVDDDNLFQILVAFRKALQMSEHVETSYILSMLRCVTNIVPALASSSRYLANLFWLPVALLRTPNVVLFKESLRLLDAIITAFNEHRVFDDDTILVDQLLELREPFSAITNEIEEEAGVNFETSFTFSLTSLVLRGTRTDQTREASFNTLRSLLKMASRSGPRTHPQAPRSYIEPDAVGYFVALWPWGKPYSENIRPLLRDAEVRPEDWLDPPVNGVTPSSSGQQHLLPLHVDLIAIADSDPTLALLVTAQLVSLEPLDAPDRANVMRCVGDIGRIWPQYSMMACAYQLENLPEIVQDLFSESVDADMARIAATLIKQTIDAASFINTGSNASLPEDDQRPTLRDALKQVGMQGMLENRPFTRDPGTGVMSLVADLIGAIVEHS
ncbi:hypothetical protein BKA62DRAFT_711739 [Auriculariales sp. MPI-PUGE-AT-0066]|nr:hypothetical protein BKA62DRAFT_711739 [Auriculariales sp. MPI-PUGE-AT-0066]